MPLRIDPGWEPIALRGNYLYWRRIGAGDFKGLSTNIKIPPGHRQKPLFKRSKGYHAKTKKDVWEKVRRPIRADERITYIPDSQLAEIKKDLEKYRKLTSGLGYPWVPVKYEEPYIYYKSSVSGLETKSFVPPEMRASANQFLKASGEPGRARILDLDPVGKGKYAYIDRGNFTRLREVLSTGERAMMPYSVWDKYTKRTGVVEKVIDAETIIVEGVLVKIKYAQAPNFRQHPKEWLAGKEYLESIALNQSVVLKIDLNAPFDNQGTVVAEVRMLGEKIYIPKNQTLNLSLPSNNIFAPKEGQSVLFGGDVPIIKLNETRGKLEVYNFSGGLIKDLDFPSGKEKLSDYDASLYNLMVIKGVVPSYEQLEAERIQKRIKEKAEESAFVQQLMKIQTDLTPAERDRPSEFGGLDWLGFPEFSLQSEAINLMQYLKTGKWGTMTYDQKIAAGNVFRKLYEEKLYTGRMRMRDYTTGRYLDTSVGFLIELGGNIAGDPLSVIGYGRGILTKVWQVGKNEIPLSHAGEQLYIQLRRTRGEYEAKWLTIQAARQGKIVFKTGQGFVVEAAEKGSKYLQAEGLRVLGTNWELITQTQMRVLTSPLWVPVKYGLLQPVKYVAGEAFPRASRLIEYLSSIGRKEDANTLEQVLKVKEEYKQMVDRKRLQKQLASTDIWLLKQEAKASFTDIKESNIASAMESLKQYKEISNRELKLQKELMVAISDLKTTPELEMITDALELELKQSQEESRATLKFVSGEFKTNLDNEINRLTKLITISDLKSGFEADRYGFLQGTKIVKQNLLENSRNELKEMQDIRAAIESANIDAVSAQVQDELFINQEWNRNYGNIITNLVERGESLSPRIGITTRTLEDFNKQYVLKETERGLLTSERGFYMRHWMTKEARAYFGVEEPILGKLAIKQLFDIQRKNEGTIEAINAAYRKKYGFDFFEANAFKIQEFRAFESIEAIETYDYLTWVKQTYGVSFEAEIATTWVSRLLGYRKTAGYGISKTPMLNDVYLPNPIIKALESDPMFAMHIKQTRPKSYLEKTLWTSDTAQRVWKFGVTFADPSWLPNNVQSGIYVAWMYAKITQLSSYTNAWTELARRSVVLSKVFKLSADGGFVTDVYGEKILASDLIAEAKEAGVLGVEGVTDISRHYQFRVSDNLQDKIMKAASWALKNSEDIIRFPMYYDLRVTKGLSKDEAASIIRHTQGNYAKSALSPFEYNVMTRLTNFYVWYKFAPTLVVKQLIAEPRTLTIPYHLMNAWNGDQGDVERQYLTDRQLTKMIFRIPGTDAYTTPAIFSLANSAYKIGYLLKSKERGFYWDELKRDPNLLKRFLKDETDVDWLNRGAGRVTVEGDRATITYVETGDSISARIDTGRNKLLIVDDQTGATIKEVAFDNVDGKLAIYKEIPISVSVEKVIAEYAARTLVIPIELAIGRDFRWGNPIESSFWWTINQFTSTTGRNIKEIGDQTIDWREKFADLVIGWYITHLRDNPMIPREVEADDSLSKVIGIKVWEVERGDYYGCGA